MDHNDTIDVVRFAEARAAEIDFIEQKMSLGKKKSVHQDMAFYARRRTSSHSNSFLKRSRNGRSVKKILEKNPHLLQTYVWHAKRFEMAVLFGTRLPEHRSGRGLRYAQAAFAERGVLFDMSFWLVCRAAAKDAQRPHGGHEERADGDVRLSPVIYREGGREHLREECTTAEGGVVLVMAEEAAADDRSRQMPLSVIAVYGGARLRNMFSAPGIYRWTAAERRFASAGGAPLFSRVSGDGGCVLFVPVDDPIGSGRIFCAREGTRTVWSALTALGAVPCSIEEVLQVHHDRFCFWYPVDFPSSPCGSEYRSTVRVRKHAEYNRKPVAKRVNYERLGIGDVFGFGPASACTVSNAPGDTQHVVVFAKVPHGSPKEHDYIVVRGEGACADCAATPDQCDRYHRVGRIQKAWFSRTHGRVVVVCSVERQMLGQALRYKTPVSGKTGPIELCTAAGRYENIHLLSAASEKKHD